MNIEVFYYSKNDLVKSIHKQGLFTITNTETKFANISSVNAKLFDTNGNMKGDFIAFNNDFENSDLSITIGNVLLNTLEGKIVFDNAYDNNKNDPFFQFHEKIICVPTFTSGKYLGNVEYIVIEDPFQDHPELRKITIFKKF